MKHLYLIVLCLCTVELSAQYSLLKQPITIHIEDKSLEEVLLVISETGEFFFSYNPAILSLQRRMTVHLNEQPIEKVLDQVIQDSSITYKEFGNHIILNRKRATPPKEIAPPAPLARTQPSPPRAYRIRGTIVDAETRRKLAHVSLYEIYREEAAVTNEEGRFRLQFPAGTKAITLSVKHRLYMAQTLEFALKKDTSLTIEMKPRIVEKVAPKSFFLANADTINPLTEVAMVSWFVDEETLQEPITIREDSSSTIFGQLSVLPPWGTHLLTGRKFNRFSFNLFAGYNMGLKGIEVGGILNVDRHGVAGIQLAGVGNAVGGNLAGIQMAGVFNVNKKSVYGAQIAGFNNWADSLTGLQISPFNNMLKGRMYGAQITGFANIAAGELKGAQVSGFGNVCTGAVKGWQVAGAFNWGKRLDGVQVSGIANFSVGESGGEVNGVQAAGLFNIGQKLTGTQVAGLFNVSTGDFQGAQIAPLFNSAKKGKGVQIGLINISDSLSGVPIGLFNFIRDGHNGLEYDGSLTFPLSLRLKTGNHRLYNIFAAGMRLESSSPVWGYGYGLGTALKLFPKAYVHGELLAWQLHQNDRMIFDYVNLLSQFQMSFAYTLKERYQLSIGPTFNFHLSNYRNLDTGEFLSDLAPGSDVSTAEVNETFQMQGWIGAHVGIMILRGGKKE